MQIAIALVTLALCGGFLWWFRKSENRRSFKRSEEESAERERKAQETAQEFVNARDLGENCLYTNDGYIFAYLKVDGVCLELLSRQEQKALCRQVSAALSLVRRPYKFSGVSRPADISKSLQKYSELAEQAVGGRKKLLLVRRTVPCEHGSFRRNHGARVLYCDLGQHSESGRAQNHLSGAGYRKEAQRMRNRRGAYRPQRNSPALQSGEQSGLCPY